MAGAQAWPIRMAALGPVAMGSILWRLEDQLMATVGVKTSFALMPGTVMRLMQAPPMRVTDHYDASGHLVAPAEMAPRLQRVDVVLTGHAFPRKNATVAHVRLAIVGSQTKLLDKWLTVYGDLDDNGEPQPFEHLRLDYENTYGGAGYADNPMGVGFGSALVPRVRYPEGRQDRPASFAPIPATFPSRERLLGNTPPSALASRIAEIPLDFNWRYFQAAPEDQRINRLQGDAWIMLEHLHHRYARLRTMLPSAVAHAHVYGAERVGLVEEVPLMPDMVHIEPDRDRCSIVWRGSFPLPDERALEVITVAGGVELEDQPLLWPADERELTAPRKGPTDVSAFAKTLVIGADDDPLSKTQTIDEEKTDEAEPEDD